MKPTTAVMSCVGFLYVQRDRPERRKSCVADRETPRLLGSLVTAIVRLHTHTFGNASYWTTPHALGVLPRREPEEVSGLTFNEIVLAGQITVKG